MDNKTLVVPDQCLPLLREHRTHYTGDFVEQYSEELQKTYEGFAQFLPNKKTPSVLDIGAGMGGIDVFIDRHYEGKAKLLLLDKDGKAPVINAGFHVDPKTFAHYCDFSAAVDLLAINGVNNVDFYDVKDGFFLEKKFDIVISLLSWGFHYPISSYAPKIAKGGVIIADVRKDTDGQKLLAGYGSVVVVHDAQKYRRLVVQC